MECHNMYPLYYKLIKNSTAEARARSEARETARHSPGDIQQSPLTPRRERARARLISPGVREMDSYCSRRERRKINRNVQIKLRIRTEIIKLFRTFHPTQLS